MYETFPLDTGLELRLVVMTAFVSKNIPGIP